jgi:hypothetical protein
MIFVQVILVYETLVRTSQATHYFSATKPSRFMLFGENRCLFREPYGTHKIRQSQSQSHITTGLKPNLGLLNRDLFFKVRVLSLWGAFSAERSDLSFVSPCQYSLQ